MRRAVATAGSRHARLAENQWLGLLILALLAVRVGLYAWLAGGISVLPGALCHWDCAWYRDIAHFGYERHPKTILDASYGQASWAFFPVFPLLMRAVAMVFGCGYEAAGGIISSLCFGLFVFVAIKFLKVRRRAAAAMAVFLFASPGAFYMALPYTEAVYAVLMMMAFWYLETRRPLSASLFAALLSGTRVTGVLMAPVVLGHYLVPLWHEWRRGDRAATAGTLRAALLPVALAPAGLFAFMLYLYLHAGDGLAFLHIQRAWGRMALAPWTWFIMGLQADDLTTFQPRFHESATLNVIAAIAALVLAARLLLIRRYGECWILATSILIPATHGVESLLRYGLAQPLFMVFLFEAMWMTRLRALYWPVVVAGAALQLWLARLWMLNYAFLH